MAKKFAAGSSITEEQWVRVTQALHGEVAHLFKPKENQAIQDFIRTARRDVLKVQEHMKE